MILSYNGITKFLSIYNGYAVTNLVTKGENVIALLEFFDTKHLIVKVITFSLVENYYVPTSICDGKYEDSNLKLIRDTMESTRFHMESNVLDKFTSKEFIYFAKLFDPKFEYEDRENKIIIKQIGSFCNNRFLHLETTCNAVILEKHKNNLYSIDKVVTIESNKVFNVYKNLVKYNDKYLTTKVKKELLIDWCTICIDNFDLNNDYSNFDLVCLLRDNYKTYLSKLR